ncbi:MAG: hypothetical protein CMJ18_19455 [Phycisphaeraceae bacterium]|nr:hypothetical protein [Phycisphaeraceae bacterium]
MLMMLAAASCPAHADRLVAGFGAEGGEDHLKNMAKSGLTAQFLCVRLAPQMQMSVDARGRVVGSLSAEKRKSYVDRANQAARLGIDIYLVTAFFSEYVEQLKKLGPYTQAYVQGPTRYISPGEKPAPGPLEERYWLGQLLSEARFAAELSRQCPNVKGFLIDVEMYGGDLMWRLNSSFDDQTFAAATAEMGRRGVLAAEAEPAKVARDGRYEWLAEHKLLNTYFEIEADLVADIARRLRREIDAVNPDFQLGMLPYETMWFYDGWLRGLATRRAPVIVCSEAEYNPGFTPALPARVEHLEQSGIPFRYMPGLFLHTHSPDQIRRHARRCLDAVNGYWLFTTYSLWQQDPSKLRGPYLIKADRRQYWDALGAANRQGAPPAEPDRRYTCPGSTLLTGNRHYPGPKAQLPLSVTYSREPDVPFYGDPKRSKPFDGAEEDAIGTVAWHASTDEPLTVVVDLSKSARIERVRLAAGHILANHPSVVDGNIELFTSEDATTWYPMQRIDLFDGRGKSMPKTDFDELGIRARYVRIVFTARHVVRHSVWTLSELAVWGALDS